MFTNERVNKSCERKAHIFLPSCLLVELLELLNRLDNFIKDHKVRGTGALCMIFRLVML